MKPILIFLLFVLPLASHSQQLPETDPKDGNVFIRAEVMPEFPGGQDSLYKYLASNLKYPVTALENGVQGKVYLSFLVDAKGKISKIEVLQSVQPDLDKEAIRVIKAMPDWIPGKQDGAPVTVKFTMPVYFKLN